MNYSIYAESTPNPEVMKFVANRMLTKQSIEITTLEEAQEIPIAKELLKFPFVKTLYLSSNFISITKIETIEWENIAMQLRVFITDYLNSNITIDPEKLISKKEIQKDKITNQKTIHKEFNTHEKEIDALLNQYIKPAVEADGGAITLNYYKDNIVCVNLKGACSGCPSATSTLKGGIEALLKEKINPNIEVIANEK